MFADVELGGSKLPGAGPAFQDILAVAAGEVVMAVAAEDDVAAIPAAEEIGAAVTVEVIGEFVADEPVAACRAFERHGAGKQQIMEWRQIGVGYRAQSTLEIGDVGVIRRGVEQKLAVLIDVEGGEGACRDATVADVAGDAAVEDDLIVAVAEGKWMSLAMPEGPPLVNVSRRAIR